MSLDCSAAPGYSQLAVTPSDTADIPGGPCRALYIGTGGNLNIQLVGDTAAVLRKNLPSGSQINDRVKRVLATGTTAADLVAIF